MTKPLSPAAQAVLAAYGNEIGGIDAIMGSERRGLATALRAAAYQAIPLTKSLWGPTLIPTLTSQESRDRLLNIAAELEGQA